MGGAAYELAELSSAKITPLADGRFRWGGDRVARLLPLFGPDSFEAPHLGPLPVDQVAWLADDPGRWWLLDGDGLILGRDHYQRAIDECRPLLLRATPEAWVRSGGRGSCVLRWAMDPLDFFYGVSEVVCCGGAVERRLRSEMERWRAFRIRVVSAGQRHAA